MHFFLDIPCPGSIGDVTCTGNGQCDFTTGQCTCDQGRHGPDCSSNSYILQLFSYPLCMTSLFLCLYLILFWTEFDCPGDGTCSNQGTCDDTTGTCECDFGYEGNTCQGTEKNAAQYIFKNNFYLCNSFLQLLWLTNIFIFR